MKKTSKNETEMLDVMTKMQAQLIELDKKVNILINRSMPGMVSPPKPPVDKPRVEAKGNDQHKARMMYSAICADCKKECSIPFKPTGDRPVYCKDCFSRRKVISLSKIGMNDQPKETPIAQTPIPKAPETQKPKAKTTKKAVAVKKVVKKKVVSKKK